MTEAQFLAAIKAAPDDDGPLLVYADWLLLAGDPRGELIQVEHALRDAKGRARGQLEQRQKRLYDEHHEAWQTPARAVDGWWKFERGVPTELSVPLERFLEDPEPIFALFWIRLSLHHATLGRVSSLAHDRNLARIERLAIHSNTSHDCVSTGGARALAASPHARNLRALELSRCRIGPVGVKAIATSSQLAALRELDLSQNSVGAKGIEALVGPKSRLVHLEKLILDGAGIDDACCAALAAWPGLARLRLLSVVDWRTSAVGAAALRGSPHAHPALEVQVRS